MRELSSRPEAHLFRTSGSLLAERILTLFAAQVAHSPRAERGETRLLLTRQLNTLILSFRLVRNLSLNSICYTVRSPTSEDDGLRYFVAELIDSYKTISKSFYPVNRQSRKVIRSDHHSSKKEESMGISLVYTVRD